MNSEVVQRLERLKDSCAGKIRNCCSINCHLSVIPFFKINMTEFQHYKTKARSKKQKYKKF